MTPLALLLLCLGVLLVIHDVLYHLGFAPGLGREIRIGKIRVHHGYLGLALILLGVLLMAS